jgi:hypothetical protein
MARQRFVGVPDTFLKQPILVLTIVSKHDFKQSYLRVLLETKYFSSSIDIRLGISGGY